MTQPKKEAVQWKFLEAELGNFERMGQAGLASEDASLRCQILRRWLIYAALSISTSSSDYDAQRRQRSEELPTPVHTVASR